MIGDERLVVVATVGAYGHRSVVVRAKRCAEKSETSSADFAELV